MESQSGNTAGTIEIEEPQAWEPTFVLLPRMGLKMDQTGVGRRLLLPGRYETRMSRRFGRPLYRNVRG